MRFRPWMLATLLLLSSCSRCDRTPTQAQEKIIRLSSSEAISTLDPAIAEDAYSLKQLANAYESLLQYDYAAKTYVLIPHLAETMPEATNGGRNYLIKIKKRIFFQVDECFSSIKEKQRELTAADFIYAIKRIADPKTRSPHWSKLQSRIMGLDEWRESAKRTGRADYKKNVSGLRSDSPYELKIQLITPYRQFAYLLAMPFLSPVPREAVEYYGESFFKNPVGTGPYILDKEQLEFEKKLIWNRNPQYREENFKGGEGIVAGRLPLNDRLIVRVINQPQKQWEAFLSGELDYIEAPKHVLREVINAKKELNLKLKDKKFILSKSESFDLTYEAFNLSDPLIRDHPKLRQALSLVYHSSPLIELFYEGMATEAQSLIPPSMPGYRSKFKNPYRRFDLARAKALLEEEGFPEGKGLPPLIYLSYVQSGQQGANPIEEYLSKSFAQIGVKLEITRLGWQDYLDAIRARQGQLWSSVWRADYPDPENAFHMFYSGREGLDSNESDYKSKEFNLLYERAQTEADTAARLRLYHEMEALLIEEAPWIWGVHRTRVYLISPRLKNFKSTEFDHSFAKYLRVE